MRATASRRQSYRTQGVVKGGAYRQLCLHWRFCTGHARAPALWLLVQLVLAAWMPPYGTAVASAAAGGLHHHESFGRQPGRQRAALSLHMGAAGASSAVRSDEQLVDALQQPDMAYIEVQRDQQLTEDAWPAARSVTLLPGRSITVAGAPAGTPAERWVLLDLNFVARRVQLSANSTLTFTRIWLFRTRTAGLTVAPGASAKLMNVVIVRHERWLGRRASLDPDCTTVRRDVCTP